MSVAVRPRVATTIWAMILLAVGFSIWLSFDTRSEQGAFEERVQPILKVISPCYLNPAGRKCQSAKARSDAAQSLEDACIQPEKYLTPEAFESQTQCPRRPERRNDAPEPDQRSNDSPAAPPGDAGGGGDLGGGNGDPGAEPPPDSTDPDPTPPPDDGEDPGPGPPRDEDDPTLGSAVGDAIDHATAPVCTTTNSLGIKVPAAC